ncbi:MAG: endonuclease III [Oscillospiraceae bacterium]|jgi:endonuclease-3|nr:endonuclease III [Oscillospiraceae bacterium]
MKSKMNLKLDETQKNLSRLEITKLAIKSLKNQYKEAKCSLNYSSDLELLISARLSARCTDARVNIVTRNLFNRFKTLESFCKSEEKEIEEIIKSCGLYKTKAREIIKMCKILKERFNSKIPDNIKELVELPGVGRKIANLMMGEFFNKPAVIVDVHCFRITKRIGIQNEKNAIKAEMVLKKLLPPKESCEFCHRLVMHGRVVCKSQKPLCEKCCMNFFCKTKKILVEIKNLIPKLSI